MAFVIAALSGDASGMMSYALQAAQTLQTLAYSRDAEKEADEQGLALLQQAGVDPRGMMTFFARLSHEPADQSPFQYLSTHPPTEERLRRLKGLSPSPSTAFETFDFAPDWKRIRSLCGNDRTLTQNPASGTS
jgi:beta-barrel assembly-enhancing protease